MVNRFVLVTIMLTAPLCSIFSKEQTASLQGDPPLSLIPHPMRLTALEGRFTLNEHTVIRIDSGQRELAGIGMQLSYHIEALTGKGAEIVAGDGPTGNTIILTLERAADTLGSEGYTLDVGNERIVIRAVEPHGAFYGMQTLLQLLPIQGGRLKDIAIPAVSIVDKPRFPWRGMMLDVGRYFHSVDFIKRFIDYLAMHKLNTFHWHLTEDHGWRIEINRYPRLTQVGAYRAGTQYNHGFKHVNMTPHWGYYTQDQIREVVAYAQSRYVNIVPEIEMPGHTLAALVAYPELSCTGGPFEMPLAWGIQQDIYCAGNEQVFEFLENVLSEVVELFPSPIIHIGGDEAPKDRWKACAKCQRRITDERLKDEQELQSYFIRRIADFLSSKGKSVIGWDEILEGGLAPDAAVMSWRGVEGGIAAAKQRHNVVMSPNDYLYFDHYQGEPHLEPVGYRGLNTLEKVYNYDPVPEELPAIERRYIRGVQGNIWSEYIHSPEKVEYMAFPRAAALAEVAWTYPHHKNWDRFKQAMDVQYGRYDRMGINYSRSAHNVWHEVNVDSLGQQAVVSFSTQSHAPRIRYTVDGSEPTPVSPLYNKPFEVQLPVTVKAASFKDGQRLGKVSVRSIVLMDHQPPKE